MDERYAGQFLLCIPTLNAGACGSTQLRSIQTQTRKPDRFLVIDSSSTDDTANVYRDAGATVLVIPKSEFDHGSTRNMALSRFPDVDTIVFLTQDAIPEHPEALARIVDSLNDPAVAAVHGRQLPRSGASSIESHARMFNYPCASHVRSLDDIKRWGIKAAFLSNSFAAYRRSALLEIDGFPSGTIMNEDMYVAAKLLLAGWKLAYAADACVRHSHAYSVRQEFCRYFDIGVFLSRNAWITDTFGSPTGEGWHYVKSEIRNLARNDPRSIPMALARDLTKLCALRIGRRESHIPVGVKRVLSMNRGFWNAHAHSGGPESS